MVPTPGSSWTKRRYVAALGRVRPDYALERSVTGVAVGTASAWQSFAPAALCTDLPQPAQNGRYATLMNGSDLLERLRVLEAELHRLETRRNTNLLEQLLHPDFVEFARSGRRYSRSEVLAEFSAAGNAPEPVRVENFELAELGGGLALLTYLSAHESPTGEL